MINRVVGNYRLIERLGEGAMGAVYKGIDLMVEREVAIKMLRPEIARQPEIVNRFHAEAVTLAKLNHPNVATLYSFFREEDEFFMVMEFVAGRTLDAMIREVGTMPPERALTVASQVLNAVEHAHSLGILHRDLKPANIMLASSTVKVTDFGIARALGQARMTREGNIVGTLEYLAPERISGHEADARSDLYSVGVVLYEMLSGHLPFERDTEFELMRAQLEESPPAFSELGLFSIPPRLEEVVRKALAKNPGERFGTAGEFRRALEAAGTPAPARETRLATEPATGGKASRLPLEPSVAIPAASSEVRRPLDLPRKRRWLLYGGAAAIVGGLALAIVILYAGRRTNEVPKPLPPAVVVPPPRQPEQPQSSGVGGAPPTLPADFGKMPTSQDMFSGRRPSSSPGIASKPSPTKTKGPGRATSNPERRKAALKALDEDDPTAPSTKKKKKADANTQDRRSESLDALQD